MIEISDADTIPLEAFSLRWRFARHRAERWSTELLGRLTPLSPSAAATWVRRSAEACGEGGRFAVTFRSDDAPSDVRERLRGLPPAPDERVLVLWDARTALVTEWAVFVESWDDFCYPSSDDVSVLPLVDDWVLCYRHYEVMQFRTRSGTA